MMLAGEATAAKNADVHFEVTSVFLCHHVGCRFARAKKAVQRLVNPAVLAHAMPVFRPRVFPTRWQFLQRYFIRRVAINLVRRRKNKDGFLVRLARGFEQVECACRVDVKINKRNLSRLVMRRLRGTVNDHVEPLLFEQIEDFGPVANVQVQGAETPGVFLELFEIPQSVARRPEKLTAQIVVNPDDFVAFTVKMSNGFGANQTTGAGDQNLHAAYSRPESRWRKVILTHG